MTDYHSSVRDSARAGRSRTVLRTVEGVDRVLSVVLCVIVFAMMFMTFSDVVGREVFDAPISVAPELTTIGLAAMVYLGLPSVSVRNEHITISLLENLFRGQLQRIKKTVVALLLAFLSAALAWQLWLHGEKLGLEEMMFLQIKKYWIAYGMSVMAALTVLSFLIRAWVSWNWIVWPAAESDDTGTFVDPGPTPSSRA